MSDQKTEKAEKQQDSPPELQEGIFKEGYERAVDLLREISTEDGFLASPVKRFNYRRVWGRDGSIISLAALLTGDADLIETARKTFKTLARHQGPHGEIPSNVDENANRVSYGGTAGRVDADLWFIIGCTEYWRATQDDDFLDSMLDVIEKVRFLLGAWEFNNRGLLYIPQTGDWADEYLHKGYVLYDELLYHRVQCCLCDLHRFSHGSSDHLLEETRNRLKHLIRANYWFRDSDDIPEDVYHKVLYKKGREARRHKEVKYWLPFFSPHGYGYRFDSFSNVLVSLFEIANDEERRVVDEYIMDETFDEDELLLLPAFHPIIRPADGDWQNLQMTFSHSFKNQPHEYHNGGRWTMISGFYAADLAWRGKTDLAERILKDIHRANAMEYEGEEWSFAEYIHGKEYRPGGMTHQGWSAAGAIIAHHALKGDRIFSPPLEVEGDSE